MAVVVLLAGAVVAAPLEPRPVSAQDPAVARVLIIGDSVTQGRAGDYTWRYRLWKALQAERTAVDFVGPRRGEYNQSVDPVDYEDTTHYPDPVFDQDHAARWGGSMSWRTGDFDIPTLLDQYAPDVVVNAEGYNDLTFWSQTPQQLIGLMTQFVADVRAARPTASIVLGQLPQHWATGVSDYNALLLDLAASLDTPESRVLAAPAPTDFTEYVDTYDPAHPTALGEMKIAREYAAALAELSLPAVVAPPAPAPPYAGAARLTAAVRRHVARLVFTTPPGATRQVLWMRDRTSGGRWRAVASLPSTTHRHRVQRLRPGHRYAFRLRAYRDATASQVFSNVARVRVR
jgi:hypothetical protein